jgi:DNA polymerase-3 subunit delta'
MDALLREKLAELLHAGRLPHAILLVGSDSRTLEINVEACAKLLLCGENLTACADYLVVRPSGKMGQISIDDIRGLTHRLGQSAFGPGLKLAIICGADRMHRFAGNALLKFLEEPPDGTIFFLCTQRPYEVLPTVRSRCIVYRLRETDMTENSNEKWREWISQWRWLIQSANENPRDELWCEAYALVHNFRVLLEEAQLDGTEDAENDENSSKRTWIEAKLSDCTRALYEISMETMPRDAFERRKAIIILAKRMDTIGTAAVLLRLNCGEVAAFEFFITSLLRSGHFHNR